MTEKITLEITESLAKAVVTEIQDIQTSVNEMAELFKKHSTHMNKESDSLRQIPALSGIKVMLETFMGQKPVAGDPKYYNQRQKLELLLDLLEDSIEIAYETVDGDLKNSCVNCKHPLSFVENASLHLCVNSDCPVIYLTSGSNVSELDHILKEVGNLLSV